LGRQNVLINNKPINFYKRMYSRVMKQDIAEVYELYHRLIIKITYLQLGNIEEAQEVTQETFIRFLNQVIDFKKPEEVKWWLIRVAVNICLDYRRKLLVRFKYFRDIDHQSNKFELNSVEIKNQLKDVLKKVDGKTKMAIILKYAQEMEYGDIAQVMNVPEGTVKTIIHRGLEKIRRKNE